MPRMIDETAPVYPSDETNKIVKAGYTRQHSTKKRISDNGNKVCIYIISYDSDSNIVRH